MTIRKRLEDVEENIKSLNRFKMQTECKHSRVEFKVIFKAFGPISPISMKVKECVHCKKVLYEYENHKEMLTAQKEYAISQLEALEEENKND